MASWQQNLYACIRGLLLLVLLSGDGSHALMFEWDNYYVTIPEDIEVNTPVTQVRARGAGSTGRITYSLLPVAVNGPEPFRIDSETGIIYINSSLDHDSKGFYVVYAVADAGRWEDDDALVYVNILVTDINDNAPTINLFAPYPSGRFHVTERDYSGVIIGFAYVQDLDMGDNQKVHCNISNPLFLMKELHPGDYRIETAGLVPGRSVRRRYDLEITCEDAGWPPLQAVAAMPVHVKQRSRKP